MLIKYKATGHQREVNAECGKRLCTAGIAKRVYKKRQSKAKGDGGADGAGQYDRRDMQAEGA